MSEITNTMGTIIAETACGHEGDINKLKLLIDAVSFSGAKIVKFQIFEPAERVTVGHSEWDSFHKLALTKDEWVEATNYAREKKLSVFADIYGEWSHKVAKHLNVDGYKIHSEDLLNTKLIEKVATDNKILLIGVGGAHRSEIFNIITHLDKINLCKKIILMPGIQVFPTPIDAHSLTEVEDLIQKYSPFGAKIGFADHVSGDNDVAFFLPLIALSKGAFIIEKHITINRADKWIDYQSALGKDDFKKFVNFVENISNLNKPIPTMSDYQSVLGKDDFKKFVNFVENSSNLNKPISAMSKYEKQYRKMFKKVPVAKTDLPVGKELTYDDIVYKKFDGIKIPLASNYLIGKKTKTTISLGEVISYDKLENKIGGIIIARCKSNRLANKSLKKIVGKETITHLIERIKRCKKLDCVILATTADPSDDALEEIAKQQNILVYRGSVNNIALRFYEAAKKYDLDQIVRITGDNILRDEVLLDTAIDSHLKQCCDVTSTKNVPVGCRNEIFATHIIEKILKNAVVKENTEYLEYFLTNDRYFSNNYVEPDYSFNENIRLTIDYQADIDMLEKVFENFYFTNPSFALVDVLKWLDDNSDIININKLQKIKFKNSELDVRLEI